MGGGIGTESDEDYAARMRDTENARNLERMKKRLDIAVRCLPTAHRNVQRPATVSIEEYRKRLVAYSYALADEFLKQEFE